MGTNVNAMPLGVPGLGMMPGMMPGMAAMKPAIGNAPYMVPAGMPPAAVSAAAAAAAMAGQAAGGVAVKQERTILLQNMFAPEDAKADEDFEDELTDDVRGECEKFGKVLHIKVRRKALSSLVLSLELCCLRRRLSLPPVFPRKVDPNSLGLVYLKFDSANGALEALKALNGRFFGGRQLKAEFKDERQYNAKFGLQ
eukprot:SAG22_NODE_1663_length_3864_cov_2.633201_2_plen_197_part_00